MDFKEWLDIVDGVGTIGLLVLIAYSYRKDNTNTKDELTKERTSHISDLKGYNQQFASLLEKSLIALQENQRFLEISISALKDQMNNQLAAIKDKITEK